jgi:hypothetical protein
MHSRTVIASLGVLGALLGAAACGKKGDECQQVADKSGPMFAALPADKQAEAKSKFLDACRKDDKMRKDPVFACIRDSKGDEEAKACMTKGLNDYKAKSQATEAKLMLNRMGKDLRIAYMANQAFPVGKAGPTPAQPCCKLEGGTCPADAAQWSGVWQQVDFSIDEPTRFQYSYESDGKSAKATAVGDLDCDGTSITYTLEVKPGATGSDDAVMNITEPAPNAD